MIKLFIFFVFIRIRYPVGQFIAKVVSKEDGIVYHWSNGRNPENNLNCKIFHLVPIVSLPNETSAWQWEQRKKTIQKLKIDGQTSYYIPRGDKIDLSRDECEQYVKDMKTLPFNDFDTHSKEVKKICIVNLEKSNWKKSSCTCSYYVKHYMCAHFVAIAARLKLHSFSLKSMQIPIGQNRARGRPKNTTAALLRQPNEPNTQAPNIQAPNTQSQRN